MKKLNNLIIKEKDVLIRVDFNVPIHEGNIIDKTKFYSIKSTIKELSLNNNKIFLLSHLGRPKGKIVNKYSIKIFTTILSELFSVRHIYFSKSCHTEDIIQQKNLMKPGDICLLENIRFHKEEEDNDVIFSKLLANQFDIYINDAFSVSHRNHASIVGVTKFLPSLAGNNFVKEVEILDKILKQKNKHVTVIVGGSKVSTKINVLENLIKIADNLIIGGAMANTFLFSQGLDMGKSLLEKKLITNAKQILNNAVYHNTKIILPVDLVCSTELKDIKNIEIRKILSNHIALDIGNKTLKLIESIILSSEVILWNGPLGAFENKPFDKGTNKVAEIIRDNALKLNIMAVAGGGDTIAAIKKTNSEKGFTYISTAGGAFLEWLEGNQSPGYTALENNIMN